MAQYSTIEGAEELNEKLRLLSVLDSRLGRKILAPTVRAGAPPLARAMRRRAPGKTLRKAIGSRVRRRRGELTAKVGLNVGGKKNRAPQAHLLTLGTKRRQTQSGGNRGMIRSNDWVRTAAREGQAKALEAMQKKLKQRLDIELPKRA